MQREGSSQDLSRYNASHSSSDYCHLNFFWKLLLNFSSTLRQSRQRSRYFVCEIKKTQCLMHDVLDLKPFLPHITTDWPTSSAGWDRREDHLSDVLKENFHDMKPSHIIRLFQKKTSIGRSTLNYR